MENSYGIGVTNRYELFYDEDVDPMDLISQSVATEKENKAKGGVKAGKSPTGKKAGKTEVNNKIAEQTDNFDFPTGNAGRGRGGDNRVKFSDREERNNRRNRPEGEFRQQPGEFRQSGDFKQGGEFRDGDRPAPRFDGERGRGRGRGGMGRGRGRGRGAGPDGRGKREFDRQSGMVTSGVKAVDKRDGSGSYNWGSDKELVEENLNAEVSDHDTSAENAEKIEEGAPIEGEEQAKTEEEQAREMTLDEYKAMQKASKNNKPAFNIRKAGEGENQAQWKKTYILKKKVEEEADEEEDDDDYEAHHGRRKVVLDIDFQFSDSPARGRGRGRGRGGDRGRGRGDRGGFERRGGMGGGGRGGEGRGGGGGEGRGMDNERGRGRGGPRGGRGGRQEAPKMDDERDFPSLG